MSIIDSALPRVKQNEGFRPHLYKDTRGHLTIGYGFDVEAGISDFAATALCAAQLEERAKILSTYWWAKDVDDVRMGVIVEVSFNVGLSGLLHFPNMLAAVGAKDWTKAQAELLDSDAARELPGRYQRLGQILLTGSP